MIEGYGYDKSIAGRMVTVDMRNPMTNQNISEDQIYRIEIDSVVTAKEMLNAMNGVEEDEDAF